jgi:hypothetical protein
LRAVLPVESTFAHHQWWFEQRIDDVCVTLPDSETDPNHVDVMFLVDTTSSMADAIHNIQANLESVLEAIRARTDSAYFGVARFEDFPSYPADQDRPVALEQVLSDDAETVLRAIHKLTDASGWPVGGGGDAQESAMEAVYQVATGDGLDSDGDGTFASAVTDIEPIQVGWRRGSERIIVLVTDAQFRDPDDGDFAPSNAHGQAATIAALLREKIKVVGIGPVCGFCTEGYTALPEMRELARATGAVSVSGVDYNVDGDFADPGDIAPGEPLVFRTKGDGTPIGADGSNIGEAITVAINEIIATANVHLRLAGTDAPRLSLTSDPVSYAYVMPGETACFNAIVRGYSELETPEVIEFMLDIVDGSGDVLASYEEQFTTVE